MHTDLNVWLDHFEYHASRRCTLPAPGASGLSAQEHALIARSIATFQLGEQSDGRALLEATRRHEREQDAAPLTRIVALLVAEEQHHAALLGKFMSQHGLPRKQRDWTDRVFRGIRRLGGFEQHIAVLITAELIGKVYYRALEAATGCEQLQSLCRTLIADELAHVGFESDLLRAIQARRSPWARIATTALHRMFFSGTSCVVWLTHRRVLRAAGFSMQTFLRDCAGQYDFYLQPRFACGSSTAQRGMTLLEDDGHVR